MEIQFLKLFDNFVLFYPDSRYVKSHQGLSACLVSFVGVSTCDDTSRSFPHILARHRIPCGQRHVAITFSFCIVNIIF